MKEYIIVYAITSEPCLADLEYRVKFYNLKVVGSSKKGAINYFNKTFKEDKDKPTLINIIEL
jgi:uncharacterized protein YihD (DUF1040 family)